MTTSGIDVPSALSLENIRKSFGGAHIIDGVSLEVRSGEIVCLLGQSGCGKTTLLRVAAGLERPTSGRVALAGWDVAGPNTFVPPETRGVGLMFQDYALFPHLTILQNVMFGLRDMAQARAKEVASQALARVGLASHAADYPHMLSGGEQQRVALARALVPQPRILLMDEPFSNLDQRMREQIREETIALLREKDITAVVVTHDPIEAMQIADRIALMRRGKIVQCGTPEELHGHPRSLFAARFFCDFNEIEGSVRDGEVACRLGRFAANGLADGAAIVCIRPQSIRLARGEAGTRDSGTVLRCKFLGETYHVRIAVEGLKMPLTVSVPISERVFHAGEAVSLHVDPARVITFAATDCEQRAQVG
jgi:iron(III) transport system ATP-binding protein